MNIKGAVDKGSEANEEHVIGNLRKDNPCYTGRKLSELCPTVVWKSELVSNELGYLAEEISKQSVEGVV